MTSSFFYRRGALAASVALILFVPGAAAAQDRPG
jgi:hypothetical protein